MKKILTDEVCDAVEDVPLVLDDVFVLEEDVEQRRVLLEPLKVDVRRLLHPLQLRTLGWKFSCLSFILD